MMINGGLLWLLLLIGFSAWLLSTVLSIFATLHLHYYQHAPNIRRQQLLLVTALPWLGPLTSIAVAVLPALLTLSGHLLDHCDAHGLHDHPHLCFLHLPAIRVHTIQASVLLFLFSIMAIMCLRYCWREGIAYYQLHTILKLAKTNKVVTVVNTALPIAFTAGILRPRIIVDQRLRDTLTLKERHSVVRHELAHIRALDPLFNMIFEALLLAHLPWITQYLRRHWRLTLEEQADHCVAQKPADALTLSEALLKTAKLQSKSNHQMPAGALSIHGADTAERIHRLLNPVTYKQNHINWAVVVMALIGALLLLSPTLHHSLEIFLSYLVTGHHH